MGVFIALHGVFGVEDVFLCIAARAGIRQALAVKLHAQLRLRAGREDVADDRAVLLTAPRLHAERNVCFVRDLLPLGKIYLNSDLLIPALLIADEERKGILSPVGIGGRELKLVFTGAAAVVEQLHRAGILRRADLTGKRSGLAAAALKQRQLPKRDRRCILARKGNGKREHAVLELVGENDLRRCRAAVFTAGSLLRASAVHRQGIAQLHADIARVGDRDRECSAFSRFQLRRCLQSIDGCALPRRNGKDRAAAFLHRLVKPWAGQPRREQLRFFRVRAGQRKMIGKRTVYELILLDLGCGARVLCADDPLCGDTASVPCQLQ